MTPISSFLLPPLLRVRSLHFILLTARQLDISWQKREGVTGQFADNLDRLGEETGWRMGAWMRMAREAALDTPALAAGGPGLPPASLASPEPLCCSLSVPHPILRDWPHVLPSSLMENGECEVSPGPQPPAPLLRALRGVCAPLLRVLRDVCVFLCSESSGVWPRTAWMLTANGSQRQSGDRSNARHQRNGHTRRGVRAMDHHSAVTRNEVPTRATAWLDPENMLSKRSQTQKATYGMIPLT